MMDARLSRLDHATLTVWRIGNVVGWGALGALIAMELHWLLLQVGGFSETAGFYRAGEFPPELGAGTLLRTLGKRVLLAMTAGMIVGLIARRIWTKRGLFGASAAASYVLFAFLRLEHSAAGTADIVFAVPVAWVEPNPVWRALLHDLAIGLAIPVAAIIAAGNAKR